MSTHMADVEYEIAQITISQQLHKQKSEILKNITLMINGSNSYVIWIECQLQLSNRRFKYEFAQENIFSQQQRAGVQPILV